ncbi:hypothetical protein C2L80_10320 [Rubneribacter badeniensis]|uniref:Uncharacterized protein n=1 Tax=Rubneribacter badeniensis TaxID=2070688 RepID=A0A2K2U350_9ACTN|nr:hypothetical protein C2L80_10320 [Rubneribacter badeniensis]
MPVRTSLPSRDPTARRLELRPSEGFQRPRPCIARLATCSSHSSCSSRSSCSSHSSCSSRSSCSSAYSAACKPHSRMPLVRIPAFREPRAPAHSTLARLSFAQAALLRALRASTPPRPPVLRFASPARPRFSLRRTSRFAILARPHSPPRLRVPPLSGVPALLLFSSAIYLQY